MTRATPAPHGRTRRLAGLLALAATALVAAASGAPAAAQDAPTTTAAGSRAALTVTAQDFEVAPNGDFRVFLDIDGAPAGGDVLVEIYDRISTVDDLAASTTTDPNNKLATFDPTPITKAGNQPGYFAIHLFGDGDPLPTDVPRPWVYELDEPGVYPVSVQLRDTDGEVLTSIVTYLVRKPAADQDVTATQVALLTSVHQPPDTSTDGSLTGGTPSTPLDPGFRADLDQVLALFAAQPDVAASFAVTPETAQRLQTDPESTDTVDALLAELGRDGRTLLGGPYVSIDPASLVANGLDDELRRQAELGRDTLALALPVDPSHRSTDTWVDDHPVDPATVTALRSLGVAHLVLPGSAIVGDRGTRPVVLPSESSGSGTVDAVTSGLFDLTEGRPDDPVLAGHQLFARLAATGSIATGAAGVTVRIDPEAVDPIELETLLTGLGQPGSFLRDTTTDGLFQDVPAAPGLATLAPVDDTSLGDYPRLLGSTEDLLGSYLSMFSDRADQGREVERRLALTASSDLDLAERRRAVRAVEDQLQDRFASITVPADDRVTLGARDARFPLPITSKLGEPAKVLISLEASDRLSLPEPNIEATLNGERTMVQIPVRTRATGDTPLRITVRTPDGRVVLGESRYRVRSTAVSGIGVLLTIGAGGFLALWWGRHWWRTRHRRDDPDGGAGDHGRHASTGDGPRPDLPDTDFIDGDTVDADLTPM